MFLGSNEVSVLSKSKAAVTIVSKNYLSAARVLAKSFKKYNPEADFYVFLVDEIDGYIVPDEESFQLIEFNEIGLPNESFFKYQYTIMELNTAVKPFVLEYLLNQKKYVDVLYIDPDIEVFSELKDVWKGLENNNVVLTPHMREPYNDEFLPNDQDMLKSGTYNLGFVGLRKSADSDLVLDWWKRKLYTHCIVDIPNGLFVDQKWMDLIPSFVESHKIIYNPAYNIAYWNLHERELEFEDGQYFVEGNELAFFHYSGYSPKKPMLMSKHQNRHDLNVAYPALKRIFNEYGEKLKLEGFIETSKWPYSFSKLKNGFDVNKIIQECVRHCVINGCKVPDIEKDPVGFCKAITIVDGRVLPGNISLFQSKLLDVRPDLRAAFYGCENDPAHEGLWNWVKTSGQESSIAAEFYEYHKDVSKVKDLDLLSDVLLRRRDVINAYSDLWFDEKVKKDFVKWIEVYGVKEEGLSEKDSDLFLNASRGLFKPFTVYFMREDLQIAFPDIDHLSGLERFCSWLKTHTEQHEASLIEISVFRAFAALNSEIVQRMMLMYASKCFIHFNGPLTLFDILDNESAASNIRNRDKLISWLLSENEYSVENQARIYLSKLKDKYRHANLKSIVDVIPNHVADEDFYYQTTEAIKVLHDIANGTSTQTKKVVNVVGYMNAQTGMGEAARKLKLVSEQSRVITNYLTIPSFADDTQAKKNGLVYGMPAANADVLLLFVNADSVPHVAPNLPAFTWGEKNIGCWAWETDTLPQKFRKSAVYFDEIWAQSAATAAAITKTIDLPVKYLANAICLDEIAKAKPSRSKFGLPEDKVLYGYFFDQKSIFERKNPYGVVEAFNNAFGNDDSVCLVIKVNSPALGNIDYEQFKAILNPKNSILIEETLSREDTLSLMQSLDVYVSLHRFEGFGLTCAEAMAMGKPVVATNYSGNIDFMDENSAVMVSTEIRKTISKYGPYPKGSSWGYVVTDDVASSLVYLKDKGNRKRYKSLAASKIMETVSIEKVVSDFSRLISID